MGRGGQIGPHVTYPNRLAFERLVSIKGSHSVFETADHRRIQTCAVAAVDPPDRPELCCRIAGPNGHCAIGACWQFDHVGVHVTLSAKNLLRATGSCELFPFIILT